LAVAPIGAGLPVVGLVTATASLCLVVALASLGLIAAQLCILTVITLLIAVIVIRLLSTLLTGVAGLALVTVLLLTRSGRMLLLLIVAVLTPARFALEHVTAVVAVVAVKLAAQGLARLTRGINLATVVLITAAIEVCAGSVGVLTALGAALTVV